jgi:hypothetical protein
MAVVSMMRIQGDSDELAAKYEEHIVGVARRLAPQHGGLGTILARTPDGVLAINLWKDEQGRHAMAQEPEIQQAIRNAGFPAPAFEGLEVISYRFLPEAVESSS